LYNRREKIYFRKGPEKKGKREVTRPDKERVSVVKGNMRMEISTLTKRAIEGGGRGRNFLKGKEGGKKRSV